MKIISRYILIPIVSILMVFLSNRLYSLKNTCKLYKNTEGVLVKDVNGFNILIDINDDCVSRSILVHKQWEAHLQNAIKKLVHPNDRVLIMGSHIGYHAVLISKIIGEGGKAWIFEANPHTYTFLKANIALNDINNAAIYNKAVFSSNTTLSFNQITKGNTGGSNLFADYGKSKEPLAFEYTSIPVEAVSIDSMPDISSINVIQMDIEGCESDAVYGAKNLIDNSPSLIVIQEWSTAMIKDMDVYLKFWRSKGYRAARIEDAYLIEMSDEELKVPSHIDIIWAKNLDQIMSSFNKKS